MSHYLQRSPECESCNIIYVGHMANIPMKSRLIGCCSLSVVEHHHPYKESGCLADCAASNTWTTPSSVLSVPPSDGSGEEVLALAAVPSASLSRASSPPFVAPEPCCIAIVLLRDHCPSRQGTICKLCRAEMYQWHEHADKADIVMRMEGKQSARSSCVCRVSVTHPDNCRCRMSAFCCALCWIIICLACILQHVFQHHVGFTGLAAHSSRCMYAMWIPCQKQATCCYQQRLLSPPWVYPSQHQRCRWP